MSYQHDPHHGDQINHRDEFDNTSLNHPNLNKEKSVQSTQQQQRDEMDGYREPRTASNGLSGFIKNPYVFCTAIFASIGGVLFGCKVAWFMKL